jgi:hypothetical protein
MIAPFISNLKETVREVAKSLTLLSQINNAQHQSIWQSSGIFSESWPFMT